MSEKEMRRLTRGEDKWIWWGLLAAVALIFAVAAIAAFRGSTDDAGIRGPADEAQPNKHPAQDTVNRD